MGALHALHIRNSWSGGLGCSKGFEKILLIYYTVYCISWYTCMEDILLRIVLYFVFLWVLLIALITGHFLVLMPSSAALASGSCEFHVTSPVLMGSGPLCHLRISRLHPPPAGGNLSVLIRRANSPVILKALALSSTGHRGSRSVLGRGGGLPHAVISPFLTCSVHWLLQSA